jgi:nickel/cobalt transporter (NicO) family protein
MRRPLLIVAVLGLVALSPALAHIVPVGLGIQGYLKVLDPKHVYLEYNLGFSDLAGYSEVLKMETSRDDVLSKEEIEAWMDQLQPKLLEGLEVTLDGKRLSFKLIERKRYALFAGTNVKAIPGAAFDTWWYFVSDVDIAPGAHTIKLYDRNFEREITQHIIWFTRPEPASRILTFAFEPEPKDARSMEAGPDWQMFARGATYYLEFMPAAYEAAAPTATAAVTAPATAAASGSQGMKTVAEESAAKAGIQYRGAEEIEEQRQLIALRGTIWYFAIALALAYGAAHALAPGHGKSMVAAHLLGTQGRLKDAFSLGLVVTFTHTAANFVIAVLIFWLADRVFGVSQHTAAGQSQIVMEIAAGIAVFLMGVAILYRRMLALASGKPHTHSHGPLGAHHHHGDGHDHGHAHGAPAGLLSLGFWAGFQPCTAGIALTLMSVQQGWLWKGLYLLVAFSLGLGLVIVAIAVAMVTMKSLLAGKVNTQGLLMRAMPVVSAATLTVIGAWMVYDVLARNKVGPFGTG